MYVLSKFKIHLPSFVCFQAKKEEGGRVGEGKKGEGEREKRGGEKGKKRRGEREEGKGREKGGRQEGKERGGEGVRREGKKRREGMEKEEKKSNVYSRSINKDSRRHSVFPRRAHCPEAWCDYIHFLSCITGFHIHRQCVVDLWVKYFVCRVLSTRAF